MDQVQLVTLEESNVADFDTAKQVAERLHALYPGHMWAVHCQWAQGILTIRNLALPAQYGYIVKILEVWSASELMRQAMTAGGEILERYRLRRGAFHGDEYDNLKLDFRGHAIGDVA